MQCDAHGIAGGPDGRCALCHTVDKANARREGRRLGWILFLGLGTASASLLAIHELVPLPGGKAALAHAEPAPAPARLAFEAAPLADTATAPAVPEPAPVGESAPPDSMAQEAPLVQTAETSASATTLIPAPSPSAAPNKLSEAVLRAALVATPISMYTAPWCGTCRRAHEFFRSNGLPVTDRNVDDDPSAMRELKARSGGTAIPVIDVDGKVLRAGFDARAIASALSESVGRRLRVQGVRVAPKSL
jgi:glutaredoxin